MENEEHKSDENNNTGDKKESNDKQNKTKHGKPVDNLSKLGFNSKTEIYASEGEKKTSSKHEFWDNEMAAFEKKTVKILQELHFQPKMITYTFLKEISDTKKKNKIPSVPKWNFSNLSHW